MENQKTMDNQGKLKVYYEELYKKSDKVTDVFLISLFVFGIGISFVYDTYLMAFVVGGASLGAYYATRLLLKDSTLHQYVLSVVYAIFTAQFIYQMHGMLEMHFVAFIGSILLIAYQNWKLQIPITLVVGVHHAAFAWLQYSGYREIYFTTEEYMSLTAFIFHIAFAVLIFGLCGYWAYIFEARSLDSYTKGLDLETQLVSVERNIAFANEISQGNLEVEYSIREDDGLGRSLATMRDNLRTAYEKDQQDRYVNIGLAKASEILRLEGNNLESLSNSILSFLVKYLGVNQAGLFIVGNDESTPYLELKACYAYNRKKYLQKKIGAGEGLIGQTYLEGETIMMTEVPDNYVSITSGLGTSNPRCIVIVPLKINDAIYGVIEFASFTVLDKFKVDFIEKIGESIATAISSAQISEKTQRLLEESQQQAEMLRSQEEEMRQNMEELSATQEEMARKATELEQVREEERLRANEQIDKQKQMMDQLVTKYQQLETELLEKIHILEAEVVKE
jgi:methyl-accepting chemotaxis protein